MWSANCMRGDFELLATLVGVRGQYTISPDVHTEIWLLFVLSWLASRALSFLAFRITSLIVGTGVKKRSSLTLTDQRTRTGRWDRKRSSGDSMIALAEPSPRKSEAANRGRVFNWYTVP